MTRSNARPLCDSRATCFMLIFAVFLPDFIFLEHNGQIHPSFIKIVHLFDPSPNKPERSLCAQQQRPLPRKGFVVEMLVFVMPIFEIGLRIRPR